MARVTFGEVFDAVLDIACCEDVIEVIRKYAVSIFTIVTIRREKPFSLEIVNGLFEHAKKVPQDPDFDFLRDLRVLYDELIEASNGMLFWAEEEDAVRVDLKEIALTPDMPFAAKEVGYKIRCLPGMSGRSAQELEKEFNWITAHPATGTIKPAKRYSFLSHIPLSRCYENGGIRG